MTRTLFLSLVALLGASCAGGGAEGPSSLDGDTSAGRAETSVCEPRPTVLLLLDTSASMEFTPDSGAMMDVPDCGAPVPRRNRWIDAIEVLTGTYEALGCTLDGRDDPARADYGYPIPHVAWSGEAQRDDGLLDEYAGAVAFGLATFDVSMQADRGMRGGCSYYLDEPHGSMDGTAVDLGIRNEDCPTGGLVVPATTWDTDLLAEKADTIQDRVLDLIPFGGAVLGAALFDIAQLFESDERFREPWALGSLGDPTRRAHSVLVIAHDRSPTNGMFGYPTAAKAAEDLYERLGVTTWVVGHGVTDEHDVAFLGEVARAGGTEGVLLTADAAELSEAVRSVLDAALEPPAGCGRER